MANYRKQRAERNCAEDDGTPIRQRGGARPGSGRPKGTAKGRKVITRSVSMPPEKWDRLDELRGEQSRGKFIAGRLD